MRPDAVCTLRWIGDDFFSFIVDASKIFVDAVTGAPEFARAKTDPLRNDPMSTAPSKTAATWRFMIYLFLEAIAETCASFSFCAHSSQHTSTVLPPILTLMGFTSSLQSQAAQVVATMTSLYNTRSPGMRAVGHAGGDGRCPS